MCPVKIYKDYQRGKLHNTEGRFIYTKSQDILDINLGKCYVYGCFVFQQTQILMLKNMRGIPSNFQMEKRC